jgi:integrase
MISKSESALPRTTDVIGPDGHFPIVRLLLLTAQRHEVGSMQWAELDTFSGLWTLPSGRSKNRREHSQPLVAAALALPTHQNRDFLFGDGPRRSGDPHRGFSGWSKSKAALDARIAATLGEPLPHWTVHDRRSASTLMADRLGVLPHIVEAILNHSAVTVLALPGYITALDMQPRCARHFSAGHSTLRPRQSKSWERLQRDGGLWPFSRWRPCRATLLVQGARLPAAGFG